MKKDKTEARKIIEELKKADVTTFAGSSPYIEIELDLRNRIIAELEFNDRLILTFKQTNK